MSTPTVTSTDAGPTRVVGYTRVSTQEQADSGAGLAGQRADIAAACEHRGWQLVTVLEDAGLSAKTRHKRVGLEASIALCEAGGADALMVAKLDRLSRSIVDFGQLLERAQKRGWAIVLLDMQLDMTTPQGELMANILASFAQFERRLIGQRTRDGLAQKRAAGVTLGRPSNIPPKLLARLQRERAAQRPYAAIAAGLNADAIPTAQGGAAWHASTVKAILDRTSAGSV